MRCELLTMEHLSNNGDKYTSLSENFFTKVSEFNEKFTLFGANLGKTPSLHPEVWTKEAVILFAIPFLAGLSQLLISVYTQMYQKKQNPVDVPGGGCLNVMMFGMPLISIIFAFQVPAGIGFYWICQSVFSFIITFALNCYLTPERVKVINEKEKEKAKIYAEKHPNKKSFMQKMMEQQSALNDQKNNSASSSGKNSGLSRSEQNKQNREKLKEARKRMAEKYGDSYDDDNDEED